MWISQINPDWAWEKWESAVVKGGQVTKYARTVKYFPQYEVPYLQKTLGIRFAELVDGVVSEESFISSWLNDFGPLSNTGLQLFRIDELLEEARHAWWVIQVLDVFKQNELDPQAISLIEAERCLLLVPNPLQGLRDLDEGVIAAKYKNAEKLIKNFSHFQGQGQYEWPVLRFASRFVSPTETEWSAAYSMLLDNVVATIDHYLALNTFIQNQNPLLHILTRNKKKDHVKEAATFGSGYKRILKHLRLSLLAKNQINRFRHVSVEPLKSREVHP